MSRQFRYYHFLPIKIFHVWCLVRKQSWPNTQLICKLVLGRDTSKHWLVIRFPLVKKTLVIEIWSKCHIKQCWRYKCCFKSSPDISVGIAAIYRMKGSVFITLSCSVQHLLCDWHTSDSFHNILFFKNCLIRALKYTVLEQLSSILFFCYCCWTLI